ncbi:acyl-CoA/acyl-ACP dehydrogenase [Alsobacter sp. SYSU M60028]|uniref:Acyl-CoA/acyl-ACP dehydrogenase n=1 Tax=Alsobacter ponti TaxID=2962936 RepID=A0ABT1LGF5_9HYPH|nr:acyl-CoA dehydrogenase family protein [Alsobacter ponti]MCP8939983.1 acyl-CoA/acyl-ACP dehydrogenase [Alsobacter ponti]
MDFGFSSEQEELRQSLRTLLARECDMGRVRAALDGRVAFDEPLWRALAEFGAMGVAIPEEYGGLGLGLLELCVIAEELGRAVAPVPFSSAVYLYAQLVLAFGSERQRRDRLPQIAAGREIGTCPADALMSPDRTSLRVSRGRLTGRVPMAHDGLVADWAVLPALDEEGRLGLYLARLSGPGAAREPLASIDPTRTCASLVFTDCEVERLGDGVEMPDLSRVVDTAAVLLAFEQLGGAERALEAGCDYARQRVAFGRQIGSFQAIKHMLANMYVAKTLARSNAYYGAWAMATGHGELPVAAATARVSATQAFQECAMNAIQVHGGVGFTWDYDCHVFFRRSNALALVLGPLSTWESLLVERLRDGARTGDA